MKRGKSWVGKEKKEPKMVIPGRGQGRKGVRYPLK